MEYELRKVGTSGHFIERMSWDNVARLIESGAATFAATILALVVCGIGCFGAHAQSEFLRGDRMPYDAFDRLPKTDVDVLGGVIHVGIAPGEFALPKDKIPGWVRTLAKAVSTYYGHLPVKSLRLLLVPVDGPRVRGGTTWGYRGAAIRVLVGRDSNEEALKRDWVLVHEMMHTALPDMDERYNWLSEGLAVYIEPSARVQAGDLSAPEIWLAMMRDIPKGLPQAGEEGLDITDTWGRHSWGGAMFCLMADIRICEATGNRLACRTRCGVLAAGGSHEVDWPIEPILDTADKRSVSTC
jgi:hypothetical protein